MAEPARFRIPPGLRREDPFVDRDGKNPFADRPLDQVSPDQVSPDQVSADQVSADQAQPSQGPTATPASSGGNLFAAPAEPTTAPRQPAYRPYGYETTLAHRGRLIRVLGIASLAMSLLGGLGGLAGWLGNFDTQTTLLLFGLAPLSFLSLGTSLPACIMGSHDLRAIQAGAMDAAGRPGTRLGFWLGLMAMLTSAALVASVVASILWALLNL